MVVEVAGGVVCPSRRVRRWYVSRSVRHFATFGVVLTLLVGLQLRFFKKSNPREYTGGRHGKTRREDGEFAVQALRDADLKCKVRYPLHVSVMTSRNRLPTFASAAHSTWARQNREQASVEFFLPKSAEQTTTGKQRRRHGLGLPAAVVLSDESTLVDVPILRYLCKWREDDFDWFLVTDDQAYVRLDSVIDFLRQVDKTEASLLLFHAIYGGPRQVRVTPGQKIVPSASVVQPAGSVYLAGSCPYILGANMDRDSTSKFAILNLIYDDFRQAVRVIHSSSIFPWSALAPEVPTLRPGRTYISNIRQSAECPDPYDTVSATLTSPYDRIPDPGVPVFQVLLSRQGEAFVSELTWERCGTGDADDVPLTSLMAASVTVYSGPAVRGICSAVEGCLYDLNDGPLYLTQCLSSYTVTMCQDHREQYSHLFYEDAPPTSGPTNNVTSGPTLPPGFVDALKNRDVTKALTLSPMRSPDDIYRLHQHFQRIDF
ncbi:hypothetical protein Bbelb_033330 [Branchiostoma belcheri]|nr:hypothetical protein Bbelb_033330 [Branchiostoma belcheri]